VTRAAPLRHGFAVAVLAALGCGGDESAPADSRTGSAAASVTAAGSGGGGVGAAASGGAGGSATGGTGASAGSGGIAPAAYEPGEELPGGETTTPTRDEDSFLRGAENLSPERLGKYEAGLALFDVSWLADGDADRDGLGPTYVNTSCRACHFRGGRGAPPPPGQPMTSMLVRLSVPVADGLGSDARYGDQLQHRAIAGVSPEGWFSVTSTPMDGALDDGTAYQLLVPAYQEHELAFGALPAGTRLSPRVAQPMIGLGLLAAIAEADLEALADPDDLDGDGVRGRVQHLGGGAGRFGWKANQPDLEHQTADALLFDMGITSSAHPLDDCPAAQPDCAAASAGDVEIDDAKLDALVFFSHLAAVPHRPDAQQPQVLHGKGVFQAIGCATCHVARRQTSALPGYPEVEGQTIFPYTDLLLHDMGEALADDRPDGEASGRDWRTPPLWGIGIVDQVSGHGRLLHDGRARDVTEAILWHGGEAEASRAAFAALDAGERAALLAFIDSL
jgi:CxxC motif-containing protein (DUF1111 family)